MATSGIAKREATPKVEAEAGALVLRARSILTVESRGDYEATVSVLRDLKTVYQRAMDFFEPMRKAADEAKKRVLEARAKITDPLAVEEGRLKRLGSIFLQADARRRNEQEAKLLAEQRRLEERSREKQAKALDKAGETEAAAGIRAQPIQVAPIIVEKPKVEGSAERTVWKFEVIDASLIPREFMRPDEQAIGGYVRSARERASIPGVRVYSESSMAVKTW
jgi:hypothetical protein